MVDSGRHSQDSGPVSTRRATGMKEDDDFLLSPGGCRLLFPCVADVPGERLSFSADLLLRLGRAFSVGGHAGGKNRSLRPQPLHLQSERNES